MTSVHEQPARRAGLHVGGRYRLVEILGTGGQAEVWRAVDEQTDAHVAIKMLATDGRSRPDRTRRILREARIMMRLDHPGIVPVTDLGADASGPWFVMPWMRGGTVADRVDRHDLPSAIEVVTWCVRVLHALAYAHDRGVVHRDIKPSNILLDDHGTAALADFGVALISDALSRDTRTNHGLGSFVFMAPEQRLDARTVSAQADLYAVAATAYNLLCGATPVDLFLAGEDSPRWADVPPPLRPVLRRALSERPERRPVSASAFAHELALILPALGAATACRPHRRSPLRVVSRPTLLSGFAATESVVPAPEPPRPSVGSRVLVLGTDPRSGEVLRTWLQGHGHAVALTTSLREAVAVVSQHPPDVVVVDLDANACVGAVQTLARLAGDAQVLAVAAPSDLDAVVGCVRAGAAQVVSRPVQRAELLARVAELARVPELEQRSAS